MSGRRSVDADEAVEVALLTFWDRGYPGATIHDIAEAAGVGARSLYRVFGSKEGLFLMALERYVERYGGLYDDAVANADQDPVEAVRSFYGVTLRRFADPSVPGGCFLVQTVASSDDFERPLRERIRDLAALQYTRVVAALDALALSDAERDDLARFVVAINQGLAVMHGAGADIRQLRAIVSRTVDTVAAAS